MQNLKSWYDTIIALTGAQRVRGVEVLQTLWSGYGLIARVGLSGAMPASVVVKLVKAPESVTHPRGWSTPLSHQRKLQSYCVERHWYEKFAGNCSADCRVPAIFGVAGGMEETLIVLEDLDQSGFYKRHASLSVKGVKPCVTWLAAFHARFLGVEPEGLWKEGCYWHLGTRPDEWRAMTDLRVKDRAREIDQRLGNCRFRTLLHGDAKVANFCFDESGQTVAAVDFQYIGGGCGMKDLAYLLGSCLSERECQESESLLLDWYFVQLERFLVSQEISMQFEELRAEWEKLYPFAWADFYRFLQGWSPEHAKIDNYMLYMVDKTLDALE